MDIRRCPVCDVAFDYDKQGVGCGDIVVCSSECAKKDASSKGPDWENFVKDFIGEVDYDRAKNLEVGTAEVPEEAQTDLGGLVKAAKRYAKEHLGFE